MTVEKCYEVMKGDYKDALSRLVTDERIKKFLLKFLSDNSFTQLCDAMEKGKVEDAFRAAHTLKGISKNLSLTALAYSASNLTEALRDQKEKDERAEELLTKVKKDYSLTVACIQML